MNDSHTGNKCDSKVIDFINDLKRAIQTGEFQQQLKADEQQQDQNSLSVISNLINVDNLSNQTFSYIVNWLKEQQPSPSPQTSLSQQQNQIDDENNKIHQEQYENEPSSPIDYYKSQLDQFKSKCSSLETKCKHLEEENGQFKSQLNAASNDTTQMLEHTNSKINSLKEIDKYKSMISDLIKSNEEKDRKIDELTKQVIRFKRIQEIVLTAQTNVNNHMKTKNLTDFEFDLNGDHSLMGTNTTSISPTNYTSNGFLISNSSTNTDYGIGSDANGQNYKRGTFANTLSATNEVLSAKVEQQQPPANTLISSCSLSSSLSTSSSSSTTSSNSSTSAINLNNQKQQQQQSQTLTAPLATISEFSNYNSLKYDSKSTGSDLTQVETLTNPNPSRKSSINSLNNNISIKSHETKCFSHSQKSQTLNGDEKKQSSQQNQTKGIRNFFGKLIRTSLVNINETNFNMNSIETNAGNINGNSEQKTNELDITNKQAVLNNVANFKRGGNRATANARLQNTNNFSFSNSSLSVLKKNANSNNGVNLPFSFLNLDAHMDSNFLTSPAYANLVSFCNWPSEKVYDWLNKNGFEAYFPASPDGTFIHKWIQNGLHLLHATQNEYEKELGIKNPFHRKRLLLLLKSMFNSSEQDLMYEENFKTFIDPHWVTKWLDDIGLPQYKDIFNTNMIDGRMLHNLTNEDILGLNVTSELHFLSIKQAIHVLRINKFDPHCLRRRPSGDDCLDKSEVVLWTNHRVMEWLRSIDLSEYAPNLRGSGVHGGLMTYENRFNSTVLADILSIPSAKTLLRRHLNTLFVDLIGIHMQHLKKEAESKPGFQLLNATNKVKQAKKMININVGNIFSHHKRTKSQDSRDFLSTSLFQSASKVNSAQSRLASLNLNLNNQSATVSLGSNGGESTTGGTSAFKAKLSILSQENSLPTSIV